MISISEVITIFLIGTINQAVAIPVQSAQGIASINGSVLFNPLALTSNFSQSSRLFPASPLGHNIHRLTYLIPNSQPPRYLQMVYDKNTFLNPTALNFVISTILDQVQQRVMTSGEDSPIRPNPFVYHIPDCWSTISSASPRSTKGPITYRILREVMLALREVLEEQQRFHEAFYDILDADNAIWAEGSMLRKQGQPFELQ